MIVANDPKLTSWVTIPADSDFPIQNLPFGVFKTDSLTPRVASRIGDFVIDLKTLYILGYFENLPFHQADFDTDCLNLMMKKGKIAVRNLRNRLSKLFSSEHQDLKKNAHHVDQVLVPIQHVEMLLPVQIGDYTDFYSSREHATNVGTMFRDPANALLPNWLWLPVAYHGRASSVIVSETPISRPKGQIKRPSDQQPMYSPTAQLDFELETAFITFDGKPLGHSISTQEAEDFIFGMVLLNDWSARDIQTWEYVPLGPFLAKNFATSISPWIVTLDALEPYKVPAPKQDPSVLSYLQYSGDKAYDIELQVGMSPKNGAETQICRSNFKYMYWNMSQQLAHHTVNGCPIRCGDLMGSGTISGQKPNSYGSLLELTWKGTQALTLSDGTKRTFIEDFDTITMHGFALKNNIRVGFGQLKTTVLPPVN